MLKNIPRVFTPDLLKLMMEMGHGEELLLADANYPAITSYCGKTPPIFLPALSISGLLADILRFFPLDDTEYPAVMMEAARESGAYAQCCKALSESGQAAGIETVERFAFYGRASKAAGIVVTADTIRAGNILLKKGVVR